jgi:hypothetical protein
MARTLPRSRDIICPSFENSFRPQSERARRGVKTLARAKQEIGHSFESFDPQRKQRRMQRDA